MLYLNNHCLLSLYYCDSFLDNARYRTIHILPADDIFAFNDWFNLFIGPRSCLGEKLANTKVFLFFGNLLQSFEFVLPHGMMTPSLRTTWQCLSAPGVHAGCKNTRILFIRCEHMHYIQHDCNSPTYSDSI